MEQQTVPSNQIKTTQTDDGDVHKLCRNKAGQSDLNAQIDGESLPLDLSIKEESFQQVYSLYQNSLFRSFFLSQKARRNYSLFPGVPIAASRTFN